MDNTWEYEPYARLAEAVIKDAFQAKGEAKKAVIEFAQREPNPLISSYCDAFGIDEGTLRRSLERNARANKSFEEKHG